MSTQAPAGDPTRLRSDGARLWASHETLGEIGATPGGGVGRIALTDLDRAGRDRFVAWCREAGCEIRVDRIGNIFARRPGTEPGRAPVMTGSHLDTQPLGGRFDGIYGVLAGLEVVRTLNDAGMRTRAPIDVAVWTDEEGVRFAGGALASAVFAGRIALDAALACEDAQGLTLGGELERIGYAGTEPVGGYPVDSFFEAHIEQGPILEREGIAVGIVLGAQGQQCFEVTVTGEEGHAGTVPMSMRRDAMVGAARMVDAITRLAFEHEPAPVITVGHLRVRPNSRNTIPGEVVFSIDARHPDDATLARVAERIRESCATLAGEARVAVAIEKTSERGAIEFDASRVDLVRATASRLGIAHRDIQSGAGHDACNLAAAIPTAMIFVPCENGISHNEAENARPEDLAAGCDVLLHAMLARAEIAH